MTEEKAKMDIDETEEKKKEEEAKAKEVKKQEAELSEEDKQLKENLEMLVDRLKGSDKSLHHPSLESMRTQIRESTSTMTSVPKPLKFLRPFYEDIKAVFEAMPEGDDKKLCSDILSLIATTIEGNRDSLKYRFSGTGDSLASWGHEYVRQLQAEITDEYKERLEKGEPYEDLLVLVKDIVPYDMTHNCEADACDLLMELEKMELLIEHVDIKSYERVCLYLLGNVPYLPEPDDSILLKTCLDIFRKFEKWPQALQMALKLNEHDLIKDVFLSCKDKAVRRQLAFMLGRQQVWIDLEEEMEGEDEMEVEVLSNLISNTRLNESFLSLARELDIMEPKTPEDIYKSHLESYRGSGGASVDSARANLASTFVNAFVNAGFGGDKLILGSDNKNQWIYKNKDDGMISAAASVGMLLLWDVEGGLTQIDAYMLAEKENIKAGALLAIGIVNSGVRNECDPAFALLSDFVEHKSKTLQVGANMGLGLAYAGSANENVSELLIPVLSSSKRSMEVLGVTALALGQVFVGTCHTEISEALTNLLLSLTEAEIDHSNAKLIALGLALLFLGKQSDADSVYAELEKLKNEYFRKTVHVILEVCAYAGTGNVLKVQKMLHICSEHIKSEDEETENKDEKDKKTEKSDEKKEEEVAKKSAFQGFAVLGIALIAMGEDIGTDMAIRSFNHLLQYGEPVIRRAVPVALSLLCVSNPVLPVLDTLSKLSHDPDAEVAYNAIFAMGMVGAGTNQARIAGMLRHLAQYYSKDPNTLFIVRLAQGILHTGKGSITLSPHHTDRTLMSPVAVSGLLATLFCQLDVKNIILKTQHYMLYHLCLAMYPRILSTFNEDLEPLVTSVRVGQAVDVVGQAGKPKTITGFITNTTPVLLGFGERAQLATEEYLPLTPMIEGFVIIKPNPEYENPNPK